MSKKIEVDSCDTLSDHVKQTVLTHPEMKSLFFSSILSSDVVQFIQNECKKFDGERPIIVLTTSVSNCFDTYILLEKLLGKNKVQAVYPHTAPNEKLNCSVIVLPLATLQLTRPLNDYILKAADLIVMVSEDVMAMNVLKPLLGQLLLDCKILPLLPFNNMNDTESMIKIDCMEEKPLTVELEALEDQEFVLVVEPEESEKELVLVIEAEEPTEQEFLLVVESEEPTKQAFSLHVDLEEPVEKEISFTIEPEELAEKEVAITVEPEQIPNELALSSSEVSNEDVVEEGSMAEEVVEPDEHHIVLVDRNYKRSYLRNRLKSSNKKTLVITRTRHNAHRLEEYLYQGKVRSRILHSNLSDEAKTKIIERFKSDELSVLLLPEAVAQTTALENVSDIIFFDLPDVGAEFKSRIELLGEHFNVMNTSSLVTNDEVPWIEAMEEELKWVIPKTQATAPQRSHNILRIKNRSGAKEKPEKTEKRVGRNFRKIGKNNNQAQPQQSKGPGQGQKKRSSQFGTKTPRDQFNSFPSDNHAEDSFNSVTQSIVNENRNPFAFDSFEASVSRQNKKRVKQMFSRREAPLSDAQSDFGVHKPVKKDVKVFHRKKRVFDIDGNQ